MTPEKKRQAIINRRQILPELLEEILLYLPKKSLLRFSSVSKSWNSMILGSWFIQRYRGRQMIVFKPSRNGHLRDAMVSPLSSVSPQNPSGDATPLVAPFQGRPYLVASCDELWCVQVQNSLILWNPSFRTFRKLPDPWLPLWPKLPPWSGNFRYGLGYDSVGDDYKILKIFTYKLRSDRIEAELYSLKSDSWKKIEPFPNRKVLSEFGLFVCGVLHWLVGESRGKYVIISFDLTTEKYGEVAMPNMDEYGLNYDLEMTVLRGMLCVYVNYCNIAKFVIWVIEDYENGKSWTKEIEFSYGDILPMDPSSCLRPFEFYDEDRNLIKAVISSIEKPEIFTYEKWDKGSQVEVKKIGHTFNGNIKIFNSFIYVEKHIVAGYIAAGVSKDKSDI